MFTRKSLEKPVFLYLIIVLGACILSFGLYNIHERTGVTEGGVLGMTLLLQHWFGLSPAITSPVMDIACYLLAWHFLGNAFVKYAVAASLAFAASHALWEQFPPLLPDLSTFPMAAAILGEVRRAVVGKDEVRIGGACGGDDALALTIAHVSRWPISRCYLFTDLAVLLLSLTYIPFARIVYSLVTVTISSVVIGRVQRLGVRAPEAETAVDA